MLRIDRGSSSLTRLSGVSLQEAGYKERDDIQELVRVNPDAFFAEMGEQLLLVGHEVRPSEIVGDKVDLLALDEEGRAVIIELKRGNDKLQLLQALTYAAMIAHWDRHRFVLTMIDRCRRTPEEAEDDISELVTPDKLDSIGQEQRLVLIAEEFDWEVLAASEWLTERYGVDIRCYRLAFSRDEDRDYVTCTCIYPPPELSALARARRRTRGETEEGWSNWEEALSGIGCEALVDFFLGQLKRQVENRPRYRQLIYRRGGRRVFFVEAKRKHAYVWQEMRFEGDIEHWRDELSSPDRVKAVKRGHALSFVLTVAEDFEVFEQFVAERLSSIQPVDPDDLADQAEIES